MNLKLKRVAPLQAGKILAAFYGLFSLIFVPFMAIFMTLSGVAAARTGGNAPPLPFMFSMGLGMMILLPLLYAAMGFIMGMISAAIYNLLARWLGGFEFTFESKEPPVVVSVA